MGADICCVHFLFYVFFIFSPSELKKGGIQPRQRGEYKQRPCIQQEASVTFLYFSFTINKYRKDRKNGKLFLVIQRSDTQEVALLTPLCHHILKFTYLISKRRVES